MATINQSQLQGIFKKADATGKNLDRAEIVQELVNRGHLIEGLNAPKVQTINPLKQFTMDSPGGRFLKDPLHGIGEAGKAVLPFAGSVVGGTVGGIMGAPAGPLGVGAGLVGGAATGRALGQVGAEAIKELQGEQKTLPEQASSVGGAAIRGAGEGLFDVATLGTMKIAGKVLPKISGALKEGAERGVQRILAPTTKADKAAAVRISKELIDRPLSDTAAITRKGMLEKVSVQKAIAGEAIDQGPQLVGQTNPLEIIKNLEGKKADFIVNGVVVNKNAVESINEVQKLISEFGDTIPDESLRAVRRVLDREVKGKNGFLLPLKEGSLIEMKKSASDSIRGILAEKYPDLAKLNQEYTFWKSLEDILGSTVARRAGQSSGLVKNIATAGAALTGDGLTGGATRAIGIRGIMDVLDSPVWRLLDAKARTKLADILVLEPPQVAQEAFSGLLRLIPRTIDSQDMSQ